MSTPTHDLHPDAPWHSCPQSTIDLRAEIDHLRLRNQELHIELMEARRLGPIMKQKAARTLRRTRTRIGETIGRLLNPSSPPQEPSTYDTFAPYHVRTLPSTTTTRPRVLHFIANFYTGGSAQLVVDLIERIGDQFEQEVVSRHLPSKPSYTGLRLHHHPSFKNAAQASERIHEFRPHLVHIHFLGHHQSAYSETDWRWYHRVFEAAAQTDAIIVENLNIPVEPYISPHVHCYVHVSDYVKCRFGRLDSRNLTIYPGSDLQTFSRNGAPIPDDCIGMVCRLEEDKLSPQSIDPFIEAVRRRPSSRALIVGGGTFLSLYQERVRQADLQDNFTFTGYVSYRQLPDLYRQMSLFVAPVHTESFGQVSPFAMGMQLPVVAYDVGALPEIVSNDALLAPVGDSRRMAQIIIDLLDDRQKRLQIGADNRRRAQEKFSVEAMTAQYARLYSGLLG